MQERPFLLLRLLRGFSGLGFLWWGCLKLGVFQIQEGVMTMK